MRIKKGAFLPIPEFPLYEINGYFALRNVKTQKTLATLHFYFGGNRATIFYSLHKNGKSFNRTPESLYRQALAAITDNAEDWVPVKSMHNLYELNFGGQLRNVKTKRILKPQKHCKKSWYCVKVGSVWVSKSIKELLAEVWELPSVVKKRAVRVIITKDNSGWYFPSLSAASVFLSSTTRYVAGTAMMRLGQRWKMFCDYKITYLG